MTSTIFKNKVKKILIALFWLSLWQIGAMLIAEEILLPSPLLVFKEVIKLVKERDFYLSLISSVSRVFLGFLLSIIVGIIFAYISYRKKLFYEFINPVILIFRSVPLASIVIFLLFWINSDNLSIYVSFIMAMPLIYLATYRGLISIDPKLMLMADTYNISQVKRIRYIYKIKLRPFLKSSIITSSGLVLKAGIAAEVIGLPKNSIGLKLYNAKIYLDMPNLFAWTIIILFISMVFEKLLSYFLEKVMIEFKNVYKSYQKPIVSDLSFSLGDAESIGIFGPSGIGKSTIINLILGIEKADRGKVTNTYKKSSVVFQENRLIEEISALDNLRMISDDISYIKESLSNFGIYDFDSKKISEFSGGMKRRVALARAYIYKGEYLVMDEPFTGLDYKNKSHIADLLNQKFIGQSKIIVSHSKGDFELMGINQIINL